MSFYREKFVQFYQLRDCHNHFNRPAKTAFKFIVKIFFHNTTCDPSKLALAWSWHLWLFSLFPNLSRLSHDLPGQLFPGFSTAVGPRKSRARVLITIHNMAGVFVLRFNIHSAKSILPNRASYIKKITPRLLKSTVQQTNAYHSDLLQSVCIIKKRVRGHRIVINVIHNWYLYYKVGTSLNVREK